MPRIFIILSLHSAVSFQHSKERRVPFLTDEFKPTLNANGHSSTESGWSWTAKRGCWHFLEQPISWIYERDPENFRICLNAIFIFKLAREILHFSFKARLKYQNRFLDKIRKNRKIVSALRVAAARRIAWRWERFSRFYTSTSWQQKSRQMTFSGFSLEHGLQVE